MIPLSPSASPRTRRAGTLAGFVFTSSSPNLIDRSIAASASGSRLIPWPRCLAMANSVRTGLAAGRSPRAACQRQPDRSGLLQVLKCLGGPADVGREERRSQALSLLLSLLNLRCSGPLGAGVGFTTERSRRLSGMPMEL